MAHDVFLSYASADKPIADGVCATLEQQGLRCWMTPRDVVPGEDWSSAIIRAIGQSRAFVLMLSGSSNASPHVKREVERAVHAGIPIIPYRIEDVAPNDALEYYISTPHWLDAFTPPLERHAQALAEAVKRLLNTQAEPSTAPKPAPPAAAPPARRGAGPAQWPILASAGVAVAALAVAVFAFLRPASPQLNAASAPSAAAMPAAAMTAAQASPAATPTNANAAAPPQRSLAATASCRGSTWTVSPMSGASLYESETSVGGAPCHIRITTHLPQASVAIVTAPSHGSLTQTGPLSLVYQPSPGFQGTDQYAFHYCGANASASGCATLNYTVTVAPAGAGT